MSFLLSYLFLGGQRVAQGGGQLARRAFAPEVREVERWLLADHVVVQGDDVDAALAQCPQPWLHFGGGHDEVTVYSGQLIAAREGRPRRQSHRTADLDTVHHP